jgi:hypothetical protein
MLGLLGDALVECGVVPGDGFAGEMLRLPHLPLSLLDAIPYAIWIRDPIWSVNLKYFLRLIACNRHLTRLMIPGDNLETLGASSP